jgi:hypothetical protein
MHPIDGALLFEHGRDAMVHRDRLGTREPSTRGGPPRDARTPEVAPERLREALARLRDRDGRANIGTGHRGKQEGGIFDGARDRADHRHRGPRVRRRVVGHAPGRGPEADDVVEVAGIAQAAAEVGAVREGQHAARDRHRRAAGRAAAGLREVVRILRGAEQRVERLAPRGELGRVGLAERHHAGGGEAFHDGVVLGRHVVGIDRRAERRADAARGNHVLVRDRQSGERADRLATRDAFVDRPRRIERTLGLEGDDRVHPRVHALDLRDEGPQHLDRGELARTDAAAKRARALEDDLAGPRHQPLQP